MGTVSPVAKDGRVWSISIQARRCVIAKMSTFAQYALARWKTGNVHDCAALAEHERSSGCSELVVEHMQTTPPPR